ncbi:hypothetical protein PR08_gp40 [Idiomarinaceae phage Phi1M2-2]|uniref:hypothetical protein n=1 Tax=Idiomarinaceae phage Phi1M2-2 TaxID=1527515 RepID=UPI0004F5E66D|nr:hypothetical protein PR08_gp40 [Idiomarinaceae phage Phi1M2-2]AIM40797.1 hypothetical protein M22_040 [Idiomarinaceae phage Phi1M2-2]
MIGLSVFFICLALHAFALSHFDHRERMKGLEFDRDWFLYQRAERRMTACLSFLSIAAFFAILKLLTVLI